MTFLAPSKALFTPCRFQAARRAAGRLVAAALLGALWLAAPVRADEYAEVQRLQNAGQASAALARADAHIAAHPQDVQMRFIKAQLLAASGQPQAAEALLLQLTQDHPELPEPWNNLAVLYASGGRLEQAAEALQQALRIHPAYATAQENLGDVRARQALAAWQRARQSDPAAAARLAPRIDALRALDAPGANTAAAPR